MKRIGEENIIFDDDVTISKGINVGRTLSDVIDEQDTKIKGLASNVKWLYKYGGVGSGSGGGGSSTSWTVQITRTDTGDILRDGVTINFGKEDVYGIKVQIYNGGTSTFKVTYSYVNSKGKQTRSEVVWAEQGFMSQQALSLDMNGNLNITILNQDTQEVVAYAMPYIVTSYRFTLQYVYSDTLMPVTFGNNTIFMSEVKTRGIKALFTSNVSVELTFSSYTYVDWNGTPHTVGMNEEDSIEGEKNKYIYLDLIPDSPGQEEGQGIKDFLSDNSNARFKQFLLNVDIQLKGNTVHENIPELYLKDNLIPSDMYLKVTVSGGTIYDSSQAEYPENGQFSIGTIPFYLTPYDGAYDPNKKYNLEVYDSIRNANDDWVETQLNLNITQLSDQTQQTITIPINTSGEHRIRFKIIYGTSYEVCYFFFVKESSSTFTWYEENKDITSQAYYRNNLQDGLLNVSGIDSSTPIEMTLNSQRKSYEFTVTPPENGLNEYDQFISIGLQYSEINDTSIPILTIDIDDAHYTSGRIFLYQNKVLISSTNSIEHPNGETTEIFIPLSDSLSQAEKTNYHLISIYKRYEIVDGESYYKTISVYLDGVLEGVFKRTTALHTPYTGVTFYEGNYFCNLFEYATFRHNLGIDNNYYDVSKQDEPAPFLTDNDMVCYYYTYKEKMLNLNVSENEKTLYELFGDLREDRDNFVHTNENAIINISKNSEIPVIVLNSVDNAGHIGSFQGYNQDNFKLWMSAVYQENSIIEEVPVTLQWKDKYDNNLKVITKQGETSAANFKVTLQGSSTLGYRCKNFELMAPLASDNDYECIFSPNFDANDTNTFLPETSFTLKADVVDSSHTNNNAMGDFINSVTTPFERAKQSAISSIYSAYIKNCLIGFPVLVFLHTAYKSDESVPSADENQFYLLGIYNFNLGRKSYFNLGYKDVSKLENITGGLKTGFNIYEISNSDNALLGGVVVGEIQGNDTFFDFSQADGSILFSQGQADVTYMFGDFVDGNGADAANAKTQIERFVKKVSLAGGYVFTEVGKTFSNTPTDMYGYQQGYSAVDEHGISLNQVPSYQYAAVRTQIGSNPEYTFTPLSDLGKESDLLNLLIYDPETHNQPSLDYASLCEYYTTCMAFGLVDSVQKNLNIKSWNAAPNSSYPLFYVAFYDMDTCLGVSNSGSRIDYFAFSDYWQSKLEEGVLKSTDVYRDFSPKNVAGDEDYGSFFDVPSSYLFAVAKYAYFVKNGMSGGGSSDDLYYHPSNLWAIWRQKDKINNPSNSIDRQKGCLSNADRFMDDYYIKHLEGTPYSSFNLNYRYKYLVKNTDSLSYDEINFGKFYGRKIGYTRNWLDGRFHLLDAYFNLNGISDVMVENKIYAPYASDNLVDNANEDIYVLKDIFSISANGNQYAQMDTSILVKSRPYAPLIVRTNNKGSRYIFPKSGEECIISLKTSGTQSLVYGGSSLWTEINTINPFITTNKTLMVNSKYFTNLVGNNNMLCDSWVLNTPSLKTISLTGSNYSGDLSFSSTGSSVDFPNLTTITISGTNLRLLVNNAYVETINALNMKSSSAIDIRNVQTLKTVNINGSMSSLNIPAWKGNGIYFPTNYNSDHNQKFNCVSMTVSNSTSVYPNNKLYVYNNDTLTKLTITGFSEVYVENCPKLSEIVINDQNVLTKLSVTMPASSTHTTFKIGSESGVVDLSSQQALASVKFNYCKMTAIKMPPHNMALPTMAFYGCSNLAYFDGDGEYFISGTTPNTFANCPKFTLKRSESDTRISPIMVSEDCTTLENLFYIQDLNTRGSINLYYASSFLKDNCGNAKNVDNINNMFYNQNIEYGLELLKEEYSGEECSLSLSHFLRVTNAARVFLGNKICGYNRYMFKNFASESSRLVLNNIIGEIRTRDTYSSENERWKRYSNTNYHILYATTDFLYEIIDKIKELRISSHDTDDSYLYFINNSGEFIEEVMVGDSVFKKFDFNEGIDIYPTRLDYFYGFEIYPGHIINLNNMFWYSSENEGKGWLAAGQTGLTLYTFLYYGTYPRFSHIEYLFHYVKLKSVYMCMQNFLTGTSGENRIDMFNFINWDNIDGATNLFYQQLAYASIGFGKKISYDNFQIVWEKILTNTSLTSLGFLFSNCIIVTQETPQTFKLCQNNNVINSKIANTCNLFNNCHLSRNLTGGDYLPMNIYHSFLKCLPKLVNVYGLFSNTLWGNPIPFDFFNKRVEHTENVFVGESERVPAILYTYTYINEMVNMENCFRNVTFTNNSMSFSSSGVYNEDSFLKNRVVDGNNIVSYEYYYTNDPEAELNAVTQNTEIDDALNAEMAGATEWYSAIQSSSTNNTFTNFEAAYSSEGNNSGCFVAPDIYYGMRTSGTDRRIINSLGNATSTSSSGAHRMSGLIPPSLLKNVKRLSPVGIFSNLNLLPWYVGEYTSEENNTPITYKCYCYVPSNFTDYTQLSEVFNFHLILPYTSPRQRSKYFVFHHNSIPANTTTLSYGLPGSTNENLKSSLIGEDADYPNTALYDMGIRYNVMFEEAYTTRETAWEYQNVMPEESAINLYEEAEAVPEPNEITESSPLHIFVIQDSTTRYYDKVPTSTEEVFTPIEGLDMNRFTSLKLDNLISVPLAMFLSGNLFKDGTLTKSSWSSQKYLANRNTYVIHIGRDNGNHYNGLSKMARLPLRENNDNFIYTSVINGYICINKYSIIDGYNSDYQQLGLYQNITFID